MHDAFEPVPILEKLPLQIDCLAAWEEWLLVGTKQGHLLLYRIRKDVGCNRFEVTLEKSNKNFSKKIQQIHVVSQFKILVSLLENNIYVHDLLTFQQITTVSKAKGASLFTCDLQVSVLEGDLGFVTPYHHVPTTPWKDDSDIQTQNLQREYFALDLVR